jgi:hypothetical protein
MDDMKKRTSRYFFLSLFLMASVSGCASLPGKMGVQPGPSQVEVKLMETNKALDEANQLSSDFYAELNAVVGEINEFRSRPSWEELEQILLEYPTLRDPDDETGLTKEMKSRLAEWSLRWNVGWEQTMEEYLSLVDKCAILEAKRLAARERLLAVQAGYLSLVVLEASAGHEKEGKEIYSVVEALDKSGAELDSFQPDDLGLYTAK